MIEIDALCAGYSGSKVLSDVSLRCAPGSVVALLGPNGAGKTTLLRAVSRMIKIDSGAVRLDGRDISRLSSHKAARAGICLIPEGRGIYRSLTVTENLQIFARGRAFAPAFASAVEIFPKIEKLRSRITGSLSGGEQQMVALARAFMTDPEVVLLDEVSMGLAPAVIDEIYLALPRLAERGARVILVEQYVERALAIADHAYFLNKGFIVHDGSPKEVLARGDIFERYIGVS